MRSSRCRGGRRCGRPRGGWFCACSPGYRGRVGFMPSLRAAEATVRGRPASCGRLPP
ncbi:hypothetical protein [Streptosporangium sp. NPDC049376]|uniref:hypothetical protein n=1 Tax=Streptosporangium sp. NPDC049376 TaxID=3366192 RepID=UPI0037BA5D85